MSTTETKRSLRDAIADAEAFRAMFPPDSYSRWEIAGSVRRRVAMVGDVEHVIIPVVGEFTKGGGLFAETEKRNLFLHHLDELVRTYQMKKHVYPNGSNRWGEKYRGVDFCGHCHEIFLATPQNWGSTLAIRTGPGEFSKSLVIALQRNGYWQNEGSTYNKRAMSCSCGWSGKAAMTAEISELDHKPRFTNGNERPLICPSCRRGDQLAMERVEVATEEQYFRLCGMNWIEPEKRR